MRSGEFKGIIQYPHTRQHPPGAEDAIPAKFRPPDAVVVAFSNTEGEEPTYHAAEHNWSYKNPRDYFRSTNQVGETEEHKTFEVKFCVDGKKMEYFEHELFSAEEYAITTDYSSATELPFGLEGIPLSVIALDRSYPESYEDEEASRSVHRYLWYSKGHYYHSPADAARAADPAWMWTKPETHDPFQELGFEYDPAGREWKGEKREDGSKDEGLTGKEEEGNGKDGTKSSKKRQGENDSDGQTRKRVRGASLSPSLSSSPSSSSEEALGEEEALEEEALEEEEAKVSVNCLIRFIKDKLQEHLQTVLLHTFFHPRR